MNISKTMMSMDYDKYYCLMYTHGAMQVEIKGSKLRLGKNGLGMDTRECFSEKLTLELNLEA